MKKRLRQICSLLQASVFGRALGSLATIGVARALGIAEFGTFSVFLQFIQTTESISKVGLDYSLPFLMGGRDSKELDKIGPLELAKSALTLGVFMALVATLLCAIFFSYTKAGDGLRLAPGYFLLIACICAFAECISSVLWDITYAKGEISKLCFRNSFFGPIKVWLAVIGALLGRASGCFIGWLIGSIVQLLWLIGQQSEVIISRSSGVEKVRHGISSLISKGMPVYSANIMGQIVFLPLLLILTDVTGIKDVGMLRAGQVIAQIFGIAGGALVPILFLSTRDDSSSEDAFALFRVAVSATAGLSMVGFAIVCILDKSLIVQGFGSTFARGETATLTLVSCVIIDSLTQLMQQRLLALGKGAWVSIVQNVAALVFFLSGITLIPVLGVNGFLYARLAYTAIPFFSSASSVRSLFASRDIGKHGCIGLLLLIALPVGLLSPYYSLVERLLPVTALFMFLAGFDLIRKQMHLVKSVL